MRARTVLTALIIVTISLGASSVVLVTQLNSSQLRSIDGALHIELNSLVSINRSGNFTNPLQLTSQDTSFLQILNANGHVIASSSSIEGEGPIVHLTPAPQMAFTTFSHLPIGSGGRYRVAAIFVSTASGKFTLYAGESLDALDHSLRTIEAGLFIADPLLVIIVGWSVWWLIGRALFTVETLRTDVEEISATALNRRVTVPYVHDEIGRLAVTMNDMLARLEESSRRQRAFVADASHELRSPLAAAQSELEVSLSHRDQTKWPDSAQAVLGDIERVRRIVEDLSVLARYDESSGPRPLSPVDLDDIVLNECTRLGRITSRHLNVTGVSGARVMGDAEGLGRAVRNLLDNAIRHSGDQVTVTLSQQNGNAILVISDDGPGVSPDDRVRIFERFVRIDSARARASGGSGLGLAIVAEIVSSHGGTIEVGNANPGARFTIRIPLFDQSS